MEKDTRYQRALEFATRAHEGAVRKGSSIPYITHPVETAEIVSGMTDDEDVIIAALLHDVAEDTVYTLDDIRKSFGDRVAELVAGETENKRRGQNPSDTWYIRKKETLDHLKNAPIEVKLLALADKLSNMRLSILKFREQGVSMWNCFNEKDPKMHEWYYRGVAEAVSEFKGTKEWQEYVSLCDAVFGNGEGK